MKLRIPFYLLAALMAVSPSAAQKAAESTGMLTYDFRISPEILDQVEIAGEPSLSDWADLTSIVQNFDPQGCGACMPGPETIDFPLDPNLVRILRGENCAGQIGLTGFIPCISGGISGGTDSGAVSAPVTLFDVQASYSATKAIMASVRENDICNALLGLQNEAAATCVGGKAQVGERLIIEVTLGRLEDNEFTALIVGEGGLLSQTGPFESHTINISFALRLDGQPRIIIFNSMPLYTTFGSLRDIWGVGMRADVRYVPRSEDSSKLKPFQEKLAGLLRNMINGRLQLAGNN